MREVEIREEPWQIPAQGEVGAAEALVGVPPPSFALRTVRALLHELSPSLVPAVECRGEVCPRRAGQGEGERSEFPPRWKFRAARQLLRDRLQLMKLALLDRNAGMPLLEHLPDALPPVDREREEVETGSLQDRETRRVVLHLLAANLFPVEVPSVGAADEDAVTPREERRIHEEVHRLSVHDDLAGDRRMRIEEFSERLRVFSVRATQVMVRLPPVNVRVVGIVDPRRLPPIATYEYATTDRALVPLPSGLPTVFPKCKRAAGGTLFLGMKNWEKNCSYPSPKIYKSSLMDSL